jgi:heme-degrading monooxygenase HmoA
MKLPALCSLRTQHTRKTGNGASRVGHFSANGSSFNASRYYGIGPCAFWLCGVGTRLLQVPSCWAWKTSVAEEASGKGRCNVFARVTKFEGPPERVDELHHAVVERPLPAVRRLDGFAGALVLADRSSGKVLAVTLWESEQAMSASEESAYWFRVYSAEAADETVTSVERYEVVFSDLNRVQP